MPFGLDVRAFGQRESHPPENRDAAIEHLCERMKRAALMRRARKRKINIGNSGGFLFGAKIFGAGFNCGRDRDPNLIQQFTNDRFFFFWQRFHFVAPFGNAAAAPEKFHPHAFEDALVRGRRNLCQGVVAQLVERMCHV